MIQMTTATPQPLQPFVPDYGSPRVFYLLPTTRDLCEKAIHDKYHPELGRINALIILNSYFEKTIPQITTAVTRRFAPISEDYVVRVLVSYNQNFRTPNFIDSLLTDKSFSPPRREFTEAEMSLITDGNLRGERKIIASVLEATEAGLSNLRIKNESEYSITLEKIRAIKEEFFTLHWDIESILGPSDGYSLSSSPVPPEIAYFNATGYPPPIVTQTASPIPSPPTTPPLRPSMLLQLVTPLKDPSADIEAKTSQAMELVETQSLPTLFPELDDLHKWS